MSAERSIRTVHAKCSSGIPAFSTRWKAERVMHQIIDRERAYSDFHCFTIFQKTLNGGLKKKWDTVCEFQPVQSCLPDGQIPAAGKKSKNMGMRWAPTMRMTAIRFTCAKKTMNTPNAGDASYYGKISKRNLQRLYACKKREETERENLPKRYLEMNLKNCRKML